MTNIDIENGKKAKKAYLEKEEKNHCKEESWSLVTVHESSCAPGLQAAHLAEWPLK